MITQAAANFGAIRGWTVRKSPLSPGPGTEPAPTMVSVASLFRDGLTPRTFPMLLSPQVVNAVVNLRNHLRTSASADPIGVCAKPEFVSAFHPYGLQRACASEQVRNSASPWRKGLRSTFWAMRIGGNRTQAEQLAAALSKMIAEESDMSPADAQQRVNQTYIGVFGYTPLLRVPVSARAQLAPTLTASPAIFAQFTGKVLPSLLFRPVTLPTVVPTLPFRPTPLPITAPPPGVIPVPRLPMPAAPPEMAVLGPSAPMAVGDNEITKQWEGYSYRVLTEAGATAVLSETSQDPAYRGAVQVPAGQSYMGNSLPAASVFVAAETAPGAENLINWMQARAQEGLGIVISDAEALEGLKGAPGVAEGLVVATRNIKLASDWTMGDPLNVVLLEPTAGWVKPDTAEAKAEAGLTTKDYLLYGGIAVAVLGIGYLATRKK